jgi:predicted HicB family RNase H-like nuclease
MSDVRKIVESARKAASQFDNWADFSNFLFNPTDGLVSKAFRTPKERAAFVKTPEYRQLREMVEREQARTGLVDGATPTKSGRFVVRLPRSLHAALEKEAASEGVSLNQLVVAKLAMQLSDLAGRRAS